ncbi:unnamed protein product [Gordionus sp. m RMFG-2023]
MPFQKQKKCIIDISSNSSVCNGRSERFVPCHDKTKSEITSKLANNHMCNELLNHFLHGLKIFRYFKNKDSCKLQCRPQCKYFVGKGRENCKNKTIKFSAYDDCLRNHFVVDGTQISDNTICIRNIRHMLSKLCWAFNKNAEDWIMLLESFFSIGANPYGSILRMNRYMV